MTIKSIGKNITHRAEIYFLIAQLFSEPNSGFKDLINQMEPFMLSEFPSTIDCYYDIQKLISEYHSNDFTEMLQTYSALFIGPFETIAPPFASVYLDDGILMGGSTMTVLDCYRSIGMEVQSGSSIENLPDHISVELDFLYHCLREYHESGDETFYQLANAFMDSHLMKWIPEFTKRIKDSNIDPFYTHLSIFMMKFLEEDQNKFFED